MSNGTTSVDQAFFYGMSFDPKSKGLNKGDAGKFEGNIDPKALKEEFDRLGSITIRLEENKKEKIEKAINVAKKKETKKEDDEMTI